jgi:phytoene synthase
MSTESALSFCAQLVKAHDYDRYLCAMFAPETARAGLMAIYAFNQEIAKIREVITEPISGQIRLQWWREALDTIYGGGDSQNPVAVALSDAVDRFALGRSHFDRLIDGRAFDVEDRTPENLAALEFYADATSTPLVHLGLEVLGERGAAAHAAGRHIGIAWGLVGQLRATAFNARRKRTNLPLDALAKVGLAPIDVFNVRLSSHKASSGDTRKALAQVAKEIAALAKNHLIAARNFRSEFNTKTLVKFLPAYLPGILANGYLGRLRWHDHDLFAPGLEIARPIKLARLAVAVMLKRF